MFDLDCESLTEAIDKEMADETVSTEMKEALLKLYVGLLAVETCKLMEYLVEKMKCADSEEN